MTDIIYCNECIHCPEHDENDDSVMPPQDIATGYNDYTCPFINQDDWFYNRMPPNGFFCKFGEKQKTFVILKMDMPDNCADCPFLDENDVCVVTGFLYNSTQLGRRMTKCPLQRVTQVDNLTYKEIPND